MDYSTLSKELTRQLSKKEKKENGIYFTPPICIHKNLSILQPYLSNSTKLLEPSCGSCEYISVIHKNYPSLSITGIEYNKNIHDAIKHLNNEKINILHFDYLQYESSEKYDIIIGNPPFYVMTKKDVNKKYYPYFDGRPNIFILFIIKSLELLSVNGVLSFVLPKNFLNCLYYNKTRKYIHTHFQILYIIDCSNDKYLDTEQETIILVIQKSSTTKNNNPFVIELKDFVIFSLQETKEQILHLYSSSKSLWDMGFKVSVGTVVWNQCKDILTNDETKTRLVYSSDIIDNKLSMKKYTNVEKKNYIHKEGIIKPIIVINRGYGVGEYKFNYCIIDEKTPFLIENHLIVIEPINDLPYEQLMYEYNKIICSLSNEKTSEFILIYFGNNAINTTELNYIVPIYL
jgi:type I restriction-modification system DNA methylase subunit